ncbi:poly-gamma-glutamate capsule biosynthesis protein, putative [Geotalea daltonii FRC-32]|uniref:Poly-gamma-glutamate capsule biosynthesis protein, putative n=1 Tax=Geotalea daltonii (strain DSM 22248 / JCM 15807 / FRC-32) TaxID=316067 RepID=B9M3E1_GEODF|nr:CapA family protein [Geotalea daltonii]ACM19551.1 poly-gamma-glutamate capsule biosynthesis protein, putative [Geotalea daltonii FRC-32]
MHSRLLLVLLVLTLSMPTLAIAGQVVINAVGDIMLAGKGGAALERMGYDYPFAATVAALKAGDLAMGNLETPITSGGLEFKDKSYRFKAVPQAAAALKRAGFRVLTMANNHMLDYGTDGLLDTIYHLDKQGIKHSGAGKSLTEARREAIIDCNGNRIAFLSYSLTYPAEFFATGMRAGTAPGYPSYYEKDISRIRANADYVIVSFHWGKEGAATPKRYQVSTARRAVEAGADLVIGHHPHVLQGIESYRNGLIFYSLGNFAFGSLSRNSDRSIIARITLDRGIKEAELIPINVLNHEVRFQPAILKGKRGKDVIERIRAISSPMGTTIRDENGRYLIDLQQTGQTLAERRE